MKIAAVCAIVWLLAMLPAFSRTENESIPPAPAFRVGEIELDWIKRGRLIQYDPGTSGDLFPVNLVYVTEKGERWPLVGSPWDVTYLIRSEMPDGVNEQFIREYALLMLTGVDALEALIAKRENVEQFIQGWAYLDDDEASRAMLQQLLGTPDVRTRGNRWQAVFFTTTPRAGMRLQRFYGTLKPFSVEDHAIVTLKESDSGRLQGEALTLALARKEEALTKWRKEVPVE